MRTPLAILLCVLYFLWPIDVIPDILVPFGQIDDLAAIGLTVAQVLRNRQRATSANVSEARTIDVDSQRQDDAR
jgi:uncharacterized membrane protein YkvA (DUF1232 family)